MRRPLCGGESEMRTVRSWPTVAGDHDFLQVTMLRLSRRSERPAFAFAFPRSSNATEAGVSVLHCRRERNYSVPDTHRRAQGGHMRLRP